MNQNQNESKMSQSILLTFGREELREDLKSIIKEFIGELQPKEPKYVTIPEASERLRVVDATIYNWINAGKLKAKKIGGRTLISIDEIGAAIENKQVFKYKH